MDFAFGSALLFARCRGKLSSLVNARGLRCAAIGSHHVPLGPMHGDHHEDVAVCCARTRSRYWPPGAAWLSEGARFANRIGPHRKRAPEWSAQAGRPHAPTAPTL